MFIVAKAKLALDIKKNVKNIASNSMHRSVMHQLCADTFQVQKGHRNDKFQIHFKYQIKNLPMISFLLVACGSSV